MLTQVQSSLPEAFNFRRYPKYKMQPVCEPYRSHCIWCFLLFKQGALEKKSKQKKKSVLSKRTFGRKTQFCPLFHSLWSDHLICDIAGIQRVSLLQTWQQAGPHGRHYLWQREHECISETMKGSHQQFCHSPDVNVCVFHREWGGGEVPTFADSTAPTFACAMRRSAAAPRWAATTCRSTKRTSLKSRRRTMCLTAAGVSPATTGRSLQWQLRRRRNSSCGLDGTTRRKTVRLQVPPGLKTLLSLHYYTTVLRLTHGEGSCWLIYKWFDK